MKFIIYGKDNCQFCTKAVALLTQKNIKFNYMKLGEHFASEELLKMFPQAKSYPQIELITEVSVEYIGGFKELAEYLS